MDNSNTYDTQVGVFIGAHGIKGALKFKPATETAIGMIVTSPQKRITVMVGRTVLEGTEQTIVGVKHQVGSNIYLVTMDGVRTRSQSESFIGKSVYVPSELRAPLASDEYFVEDLVGLDVVTTAGRALGKITSVIQEPAHDVYETDLGALIPAVKAFVLNVDVSSGKMTVTDADGLLATDSSDSSDAVDEDGEEEDEIEAIEEESAERFDGAELTALERIQRRKFGAKR